MTTQLLATELANLIQESKRKHNDLRQAAERSLEELKSLGNVPETAAPELLSQKPSFVNPFIIACGTKNAKFTGIAIVCLQRLIVAKALPRSKLNQVLEALMQASSAGLDVQLKILQALPSLLQNYSSDLNGNLLVTALNICFILQSSKNAIVNNTSAATLQQLVVSVFDKVVAEDKNGGDAPIAGEAPSADGKVELRAAALDAYRIFNDLCLLTENQRSEFLRFSGLQQTFGLELIESVITNHASVFLTHPEQAHILRDRVMPLLMSALKGKPSFATTVRLVRILYTLLRRHISILPSECGDALSLLTTLLDQDTTIWKRALCMEVFRGIFAEHALVRRIFTMYDAKEGEKDIVKTLIATFVRLSTEKPAVIGLGHQSSIPIADPSGGSGLSTDQALIEATSVTGIISGSIGSEISNIGISVTWSSVRVPCIDQLDKAEAPTIPESYIYSLILACLSSLSDGLAKFILPLTVPNENRARKKASKQDMGRSSPAPSQLEAEGPSHGGARERSASFKKNPVPINPLELEDHPAYSEVKVCSDIVNKCWPAILATCSTFLYAALDSEYYHGLVRAFQRFAHVAGLLQLPTPRDAFLSTLGKAAVPPNVLSACVNAGQSRSTATTPTETSSSVFSNARGLLSVENLSQVSSPTERQRQGPVDASITLNTRNLLCLRALLNLGIALGPTLGLAWGIILETLQQADFVLYVTGKAPGRTQSLGRGGQDYQSESDANSLMANFGSEVRSVETAASRLIESSVDFPNESFVEVVQAICGLLPDEGEVKPNADDKETSRQSHARSSSGQHRRVLSFSGQSTASNQELQFALAKMGEIAMINLERLLAYDPTESGWDLLVHKLIQMLDSSVISPSVRTRASEILAKLVLEAANAAGTLPPDIRGAIQLRLFGALRDSLKPLQKGGRDISVSNATTDIEIHRIILDGLRGVIEDCGQTLVSGWDVTFDIIGSVFTAREIDLGDHESTISARNLGTRSSKLVRSSFSSLQLICSDFLPSLPNSCFLILVDTLYKFCSQDDDLNIALTTVTFFWALSDFLSGKDKSLDITIDLFQAADVDALERLAADHGGQGSDAALWMLLLLRLTAVASDDRVELRNTAIQTLLRIFDAYGERLSPEAWSICIKSVVFKLLASLEGELKTTQDEEVDETDRVEWHDTAVVVLNGISTLLGNNLEVLTAHSSFNELWNKLLEHLATLLDFKVLDINTATFKALSHVLSQSGSEEKPVFNETTVRFAWDLWSRGIPITKSPSGKAQDNQNCLTAYVAALREVYRLIKSDITVERVQRILGLLRHTVEEASVGSYATDIDNLTQLQAQVLDAVKMIRTDISGVPSALIKQVSEFVTLAYDQYYEAQPPSKRTYVAMSKTSMQMLEGLVVSHSTDTDIYTSGAVSAALSALLRPIALKYQFPITTRTVQPWKLATSTVLTIAEATLSKLDDLDIPTDTIQGIWQLIAEIADGILSADCDNPPPGTSVAEDEAADIAWFHKLVELVIPSMGSEKVKEETRSAYTRSLFKTSIIHEPPSTDKVIIQDGGAGLPKLYQPRAGLTTSVPPTQRTKMAYVVFEELFLLISTDEPAAHKPSAAKAMEDHSASRTRIACTAAPFLILRCALTLRAYVSDQPLRGKMPQPLSQRKELLWTLQKLVGLQSQSEAIPPLEKAQSDVRKHLLRLYPLIVKALRVQGDEKVLSLLREALDVIGGEFGVV
ncbi:dimerization and cyclophilin-binding domain of mon2 domain-containing protein [Trichoderma breve]|uniref:Dimerization and cyclophilin-binding domain of mon2 domain-containing protein n=1 Tax=Trichoderma breve TaxID=2034170 RepID=A0A9W9BC28_9HYPO|nr:dimerization and cyclophilin-binding domain of mon2 domain-containing protein [Trichoderma breve]KAJ4858609.1 dimerization and cyclophilin-binding domain of mon2 domain-containing protein [Trichoderma breve]